MTQDIWGVPDPYSYLRNLTDEVLSGKELRRLVLMACRDVRMLLQEWDNRSTHAGKRATFDGKPAYDRREIADQFLASLRTLIHVTVLNDELLNDEIRHLTYVLPRPKRKRALATAPALTAVERRAQHAQKKLKEWQRKSKLAATKMKAYRKRVNYYKKRGKL